MRSIKFILAFAALLLGTAWTVPAMAYGHYAHARVGVFIGPGFGPWYNPWPYAYGPYGYGYPYGYPYGPYPYYYDAPAFAPAAPSQYVEREPVQAAPASWYYCSDPQGYYPYVQQCRTSWQRVSPTPPGVR